VASEKPLAPSTVKVFVSYSPAPGAGVNDPASTYVDGYVINPAPLPAKEHQVTWSKSRRLCGCMLPRGGLLPRGSWELDTMSSKDELHEARAVKSRGRCRPAIRVLSPEKLFCSCDYSAGARAGRSCGPRASVATATLATFTDLEMDVTTIDRAHNAERSNSTPHYWRQIVKVEQRSGTAGQNYTTNPKK
jgi:hypothetical protein